MRDIQTIVPMEIRRSKARCTVIPLHQQRAVLGWSGGCVYWREITRGTRLFLAFNLDYEKYKSQARFPDFHFPASCCWEDQIRILRGIHATPPD